MRSTIVATTTTTPYNGNNNNHSNSNNGNQQKIQIKNLKRKKKLPQTIGLINNINLWIRLKRNNNLFFNFSHFFCLFSIFCWFVCPLRKYKMFTSDKISQRAWKIMWQRVEEQHKMDIEQMTNDEQKSQTTRQCGEIVGGAMTTTNVSPTSEKWWHWTHRSMYTHFMHRSIH